MRLIACVLSLGLLSAGCAMQTGDPSAPEADSEHPTEIVTVPGSAGTTRAVSPTEATPDQTAATLGGALSAGAEGHTPPAATAAGVSSPNGPPQGDNPNPQPWESSGITFHGPVVTGGR